VLSARYALRRQRLRRDPARAACRSALVLDGLADLAEDERDARGDRPQRPVEVAAIVRWADAHGAGYDAWAWDTWGTCSALVGDYAGAPHGAYGRWAHAHYSRNRVAPLRVRR
jgi:hypothetical protein